jgi:glycosyltransferase involved in cell wall biosynthesis
VIPNGVDTGRFRPDPERRGIARAALGLGGEFVWLAAGRLMWKKNYSLLLRAMERQSRAALLIAGAGPDEDALRATAPANARFLGARTDLPELMNAADAFVLSSDVEGLPMVLLEAGASGLPCVATRVGGVAEAMLDGHTGYLVPPGDADALGAAMTRMASLTAAERAAMGHEARAYALARFDLAAVVEQWEHLYRALLVEEA